TYITRVIDRSDYYVLIIGACYGSLTEEGISFTEAEYDYAVKKEIPVLAFFARKPEDLPQRLSDGEHRLAKKLQPFQEMGSGGETRRVGPLGAQGRAGGQGGASLGAAISEFPRPGWVRGDQAAGTEKRERGSTGLFSGWTNTSRRTLSCDVFGWKPM